MWGTLGSNTDRIERLKGEVEELGSVKPQMEVLESRVGVVERKGGCMRSE